MNPANTNRDHVPMPFPVLAVAALVFDREGRLLLVQRDRPPATGLWTVPGGRVEHGEHVADALAREVMEETGLLVRTGRLVEVAERITATDEGTWHYVILDYLADVIGGALAAGSDVRDARFVSPDELVALALTPGLIPVIARARSVRQELA